MTTQAEQRRDASPLTIFSPAKVNLFLKILQRRGDGFHELQTIMAPLDFGDEIVLAARPSGITLECDLPSLPTDDRNLAVRAAKLLAQTFGVHRGAHIRLQKRIPIAAGLAGGSSNAAAVLNGLNRLWRLSASAQQLGELAATLGSDINFFIKPRAAICTGRGEQVATISHQLRCAVLLVNPGFGISTKWAYQMWSPDAAATLTPPAPEVSLLVQAMARGDCAGLGRYLYNSLEAPSVHKFPVLHLLKQAMARHGAAGALMSGSGATVFGLFERISEATAAAVSIQANFGPSMWTKVCGVSQSSEP